MPKRIALKIYGNVQGVNYRYYSSGEAQKFGIAGWVKNEPDGTVSIIAEGEEESLKKFIDWCYNGPRYAEVSDVKIDWQKYTGQFRDFEIRY